MVYDPNRKTLFQNQENKSQKELINQNQLIVLEKLTQDTCS